MVLKDKSGVRFVTLNSTLTKIDSQKPLPFVVLTAPECSGVYIYEDAKENVALERCTDVITNMIIKYGPLLKRKWAVEEWLRNIHVGCFWKELAVKRYGRYVENMKKWKFGLGKSAA